MLDHASVDTQKVSPTEELRHRMRHSAAHVMADAVLQLFPPRKNNKCGGSGIVCNSAGNSASVRHNTRIPACDRLSICCCARSSKPLARRGPTNARSIACGFSPRCSARSSLRRDGFAGQELSANQIVRAATGCSRARSVAICDTGSRLSSSP